jgi:hypothetical protein
MPTPATLYATVLAKLKVIEPTASFDVTHYVVSLGAAHGTTGQYAISYAAGATIEAIIQTRASQRNLYGTGLYVRTDALMLTLTAVSEGDEIKDGNDLYFKVDAVRVHPVGDVTVEYEVDLIYLPLHA